MKYTQRMRINGELACRALSEKADNFYSLSEPLTVYEYEKDDDTLYACTGIYECHDVTFKELDRVFSELWDLVTEDEQEDE